MLDREQKQAFESAVRAMAEFKRVFGRHLAPDIIAELYTAEEFGLELVDRPNEPGHDAVAADGKRYQVKYRNAQNVDLKNFDFDFLVLVNLDDDYKLLNMWLLSADETRLIFTWREGHQKFQAPQKKVKARAKCIR